MKVEVDIDWPLGTDVYFLERVPAGEDRHIALPLVGKVVAIRKHVIDTDELQKASVGAELIKEASEDWYLILTRGSKRARLVERSRIHSQAVSALVAAQDENEGKV